MSIRKYIHSLIYDQRQGLWDGFVISLLWSCSLIYGLIVRLVRYLYAVKALPSYRCVKPVISIGNITVGGSGKTPLVIAVVQALALRQLRAAVLIRGYMPDRNSKVSDEVQMLKEQLPEVPVMAGANRRASIEECLKHHAVDVFVCDDAFQHWPLRRDLDIVAIDAVNPFGNGHLLPRGILREGIDGLGRAQVIALTKTDQPHARSEEIRKQLESINPKALIVESHHKCMGLVDVYQKKTYDHYYLKGVTVVAFCAIGDPNSFRANVQQAGFNVANVFVFMDHHIYTEEEMALVRRFATEHQIQIILTTHKDAVKLKPFEDFWKGFKVYYLQVELEITYGKNVFLERIISVVRH